MTACAQFEMLKPYNPIILDAGIQNKNGDIGICVKVGGISTVLWDDAKDARFEDGWFWTEDENGEWWERFYVRDLEPINKSC